MGEGRDAGSKSLGEGAGAMAATREFDQRGVHPGRPGGVRYLAGSLQVVRVIQADGEDGRQVAIVLPFLLGDRRTIGLGSFKIAVSNASALARSSAWPTLARPPGCDRPNLHSQSVLRSGAFVAAGGHGCPWSWSLRG